MTIPKNLCVAQSTAVGQSTSATVNSPHDSRAASDSAPSVKRRCSTLQAAAADTDANHVCELHCMVLYGTDYTTETKEEEFRLQFLGILTEVHDLLEIMSREPHDRAGSAFDVNKKNKLPFLELQACLV